MLKKAKNTEFWKQVRNSPAYEPIIKQIKKIYDDNHENTISVLRYSDRWLCYKEGNRSAMEKHYFRRRHALSSSAILALLYPEESCYLTELQDLIWAICDEYCWAVPAHTSGELHDDLTAIDLFTAETGLTLAEICNVFGERLESAVKERAEYEVRRRVIEPFKSRQYWWETRENNWSAVCTCCTAGAYMYLEPELFDKYIPQFLSSMNCFISGFPQDGTCLEGHSYWIYGFGYYLWFADMLYNFTNGKYDLLQGEKIKNIAGYMQRNFLLGGSTISFADGTMNGNADMAIQYYLHSRMPDTIELLSDRLAVCGSNVKWINFIRTFIYFDPNAQIQKTKLNDYYLPQAQQLIINRDSYSFVIKAGHNDEPHNHNDVGNFIFCDKSGQSLCDLGAGRYTVAYFNPDTRYDIFCNSSLSHNVPIIGGMPQKAGIDKKGSFRWDGNTVEIEMAEAYSLPSLKTLTRKVTVNNNNIVLCDNFDTDESITERFVSLRKPQAEKDRVIIGETQIKFDSSVCTVSISTETHQIHSHKAEEQTVYCIDFELKNKAQKAVFEISANI